MTRPHLRHEKLCLAPVARAIRFVRLALIHAPGLGQGHGPMGHALDLRPFEEWDA